MKKALILAAALSASAALAACDRADDPASMTSEPGGTVTMPSPAPAPENNLGGAGPANGTMGGTPGDATPMDGAPAAPMQ